MKYWPLDQLFWLSGEETVSLCDQKNVQMMSGRPNALVLKNYCNVVPSSIHLQWNLVLELLSNGGCRAPGPRCSGQNWNKGTVRPEEYRSPLERVHMAHSARCTSSASSSPFQLLGVLCERDPPVHARRSARAKEKTITGLALGFLRCWCPAIRDFHWCICHAAPRNPRTALPTHSPQ